MRRAREAAFFRPRLRAVTARGLLQIRRSAAVRRAQRRGRAVRELAKVAGLREEKLRIFLAAMLAGILVAACTSTEAAVDKLTMKYSGQPIEDFIEKHGAPVRSYRLQDGSIRHEWISEVRTYRMPGVTTVQTRTVDDTIYVTATHDPAYSFKVYCRATIMTDATGAIIGITLRGTVGRWTTSRCHEVFSDL